MNPFASRFVRPDHNVYRFELDEVIDNKRREAFVGKLIATLRTKRCAAIVGPHGTGKTTLLRTIESDLRSEFEHVAWSTLTTNKRHSHRELLAKVGSHNTTCLIVDGYEQLHWWHRLALIHRIKQQKSTVLLITCHRPPQLIAACFQTRWNESIARFLTAEKLDEIPESTRARLWVGFEHRLKDTDRESRNLRELWFSLYDEYEITKKLPFT